MVGGLNEPELGQGAGLVVNRMIVEEAAPISKEQPAAATRNAEQLAREREDVKAMGELAASKTAASKTESPDVGRDCLMTIASGGNIPRILIDKGQGIRREAEGLTGDEKQIKLSEGYDKEIGGLQIQMNQEKNTKKRETIQIQINVLQEERDKLSLNGEPIPNQFNQLADAVSLGNAEFVKAQIKNKSPLVAVYEVINHAATNKEARTTLIKSLKQSELFSGDQMTDFEKQMDKLALQKKVEKGVSIAGKMGFGALLMSLLAMYLSRDKKQQGQMA